MGELRFLSARQIVLILITAQGPSWKMQNLDVRRRSISSFHQCPASLMCALEVLASLGLLAPRVCESASLLMTIPRDAPKTGMHVQASFEDVCFVMCLSLLGRFGFRMLHLPKCTCYNFSTCPRGSEG